MTLTKEKSCECIIVEKEFFANSKHRHESIKTRPSIAKNILETIGNTPLVRLNSVGKKDGIECEILVKCEFMNPAGSVKERISKRMIEAAEKRGEFHKGDMIIEATSGNTGIGLALAAAVKGYGCTIALPEKMSLEKVNILKALGAKIIRTRTSAKFQDPDSHIQISRQIRDKDPEHIHLLDQYSNIDNPLTHYDETGEEIVRDCGDKLPDMVVLSIGTGGTMTGVALRVKQANPNCIIVGIDPAGSILAKGKNVIDERNESVQCYDVEGIGYDFVPEVFDDKNIDMWVRIYDQDSFAMARRLIKEEGLFCGGSSGAVMYGALVALRKLKWGPEKRVVVLLADSVRNYMSKFLVDEWTISKGHMDLPSNDISDSFSKISLKEDSKEGLKNSLKEPVVFKSSLSVKEVLESLKSEKLGLTGGLGLITEDGTWGPDCVILGVVDSKKMIKDLLMNNIKLDSLITTTMNKEYRCAELNQNEDQILRVILLEAYCVVKTKKGPYIVNDDDFLKKLI